MEYQFTTEMIQALYDRAIQYSIAKYGSEPDRVRIEDDGQIRVTYEDNRPDSCESDNDDYWINAEDLGADLDKLAEERKERERLERIAREEQRRKDQIERKKIEKENRRIQYLNLKKEFES